MLWAEFVAQDVFHDDEPSESVKGGQLIDEGESPGLLKWNDHLHRPKWLW